MCLTKKLKALQIRTLMNHLKCNQIHKMHSTKYPPNSYKVQTACSPMLATSLGQLQSFRLGKKLLSGILNAHGETHLFCVKIAVMMKNTVNWTDHAVERVGLMQHEPSQQDCCLKHRAHQNCADDDMRVPCTLLPLEPISTGRN